MHTSEDPAFAAGSPASKADANSALQRLVQALTRLPADDVANVEVLLRAGELLVAFETLCAQVDEWSVPISSEQVDELGRVGRYLQAEPRYVERLGRIE